MKAGIATNKIDFSCTWYENMKNTKLVFKSEHKNWLLLGLQNSNKFDGKERAKVAMADTKAKISLL